MAAAATSRAAGGGSFWVHLDVDVFGETEFPATDYLMPGGLTVESGHRLLEALGGDERLIGVSVGCYNPEKDPEGRCGADLVELLASVTR